MPQEMLSRSALREARTASPPGVSTPRVMIVCTGNVIRSPFIAGLLARAAHDAGVDIAVTSAGTVAPAGSPAMPRTRDLARAHGIDLEVFRARQLVESHVDLSTTVLCATHRHTSEILHLRPARVRDVFTVGEFGMAVTAVMNSSPDRIRSWRTLTRLADEARRTFPVESILSLDIPDPIGRDDPVWRDFERRAIDAVNAAETAMRAMDQDRGFMMSLGRQRVM